MKKIFNTIIALAIFTATLGFGLISTACRLDDPYLIRITASLNPHSHILRHIEADLYQQGFRLDIRESGWELQNDFVRDGEVLANFFQHRPFLENWNTNVNTGAAVVPVAGIHFEPLGIFPGTRGGATIAAAGAALQAGDRIIFPNDATNGTRALNLLEYHGLISWIGGNVPRNNLVTNWSPVTAGVLLYPVLAGNLPDHRPEAGLAVINGNIALQANLIEQRIVYESAEIGARYTNFLAVKDGNESDPRIIALINALQSEGVKAYIETRWQGAIVPYFLNAEGARI